MAPLTRITDTNKQQQAKVTYLPHGIFIHYPPGLRKVPTEMGTMYVCGRKMFLYYPQSPTDFDGKDGEQNMNHGHGQTKNDGHDNMDLD